MTAELVRVLLVGLAAWRLASWIVVEYGPGDVFYRLRLLVGADVREGEAVKAVEEMGLVARGLQCVWCVSVWTAVALWALWELHWAAAGIPAAMSVAVLIEQAVRRT